VRTDFHGRGASFPLEISTTGGIRESAGAQKIEESIRIILGTQYGERVMRPTFGCNLKSLVFAPLNEATINLARHYVEEGLQQWEPRMELIDVLVEPDPRRGILLMHVHYRIKATQDVRSLVYPFYVEQP
jgi:uncharacterized protein